MITSMSNKKNKPVDRMRAYREAHSAGWDAGNAAMKAAGRHAWNDEDYLIASKEMKRVLGEVVKPKILNLCQACSGPGANLHVCPFADEVDDKIKICDCCAECTDSCAAQVKLFEKTNIMPKLICGRCKGPGVADHTCPYKEEIGDDGTTLCNCCDKCRTQCLWDIKE